MAGQHTLITVLTLDLAIVARLRAFFAEMTHFFTVPTCDICWVSGLVALLGNVTLFATVAARHYCSGRTVF